MQSIFVSCGWWNIPLKKVEDTLKVCFYANCLLTLLSINDSKSKKNMSTFQKPYRHKPYRYATCEVVRLICAVKCDCISGSEGVV